MAVPRAKTSKARTHRRQSINMKLTAPTLVACGNCGNPVLMHRVCPKCGFYRGRQVFAPENNG
ncbi:MAG: 50S ribosomal protein L32 [Spirochaetia bacterium]|jgi:large subunit ribosomal protein L32|nr:50S ribosomal protein L32 [Spirochaetales bacterium]MBP7095571.1 50S ribosomal protein L32 [Spirochaetia bacterium]HOX17839.1 50S ribosomal protein L32 [Spirochaetales bacterium]